MEADNYHLLESFGLCFLTKTENMEAYQYFQTNLVSEYASKKV